LYRWYFVGVNNGLSKGIETPQRCFNVLSVRSYQSFPCFLGEDILSAECVDGDIKGPASGRRGGPIHEVNLSPAPDPRSSGGRGRAPPLPSFGRMPWKLFSFSCSVVGRCHFSCGEGLFRWASTRFTFGAGFSKKVPSSFPPALFRWGPPSRLLRRKRTLFS
jgi:hypothetical protein